MPFLKYLTQNQCINILKNKQYHQKYVIGLIENIDFPDIVYDNDHEEKLNSLRVMASKIKSNRVRRTIEMKYFERMDSKEITEILKINTLTLYRYSDRGKVLMKKMM